MPVACPWVWKTRILAIPLEFQTLTAALYILPPPLVSSDPPPGEFPPNPPHPNQGRGGGEKGGGREEDRAATSGVGHLCHQRSEAHLGAVVSPFVKEKKGERKREKKRRGRRSRSCCVEETAVKPRTAPPRSRTSRGRRPYSSTFALRPLRHCASSPPPRRRHCDEDLSCTDTGIRIRRY
jgi:hypothetical protein